MPARFLCRRAHRIRAGSWCVPFLSYPGISFGKILRAAVEFSEFRHPFVCYADFSPVRGITPPLRIEKPFGRAEKKKSLQPTCPYLQCGSPHRVLNLSITLKVPKSGLWKRFSFANFAGNCTIVFRKPNICSISGNERCL